MYTWSLREFLVVSMKKKSLESKEQFLPRNILEKNPTQCLAEVSGDLMESYVMFVRKVSWGICRDSLEKKTARTQEDISGKSLKNFFE